LAAVPSIGRASRVEGAAAPEAAATRELYERYADQIFRYCLHQLGSREEAEDAVQSTFLNAFRGIKRGVVPDLESAWLFKIAHNVCLSRRRSSWRRGRIESPTDFEVVEELAAAPPRLADELIGLQDVLEQLPETQRRAILLREWQGLSYREIATELELSQAAVETLIFRARRSLATGLEEPPAPGRRGFARALDLGAVFTGVKSLLLGGSAATKIAATVAAVSATTVVAAAPVVEHHGQIRPQPTRSVPHTQPVPKKAAPPSYAMTVGATPAPSTKVRAVSAHAAASSRPVKRSTPPIVQRTAAATVAERPVTPDVVRAPASKSQGRAPKTAGAQGQGTSKGHGTTGHSHASGHTSSTPVAVPEQSSPEQSSGGSSGAPQQRKDVRHQRKAGSQAAAPHSSQIEPGAEPASTHGHSADS
jgi:RNA polymerase sigma factor (sigma-70 family)